MIIKAYILNSFAKTKNGGNPAGIVLNANNLSDKEMQKTAKKINLSETAFVLKSKKTDFELRFFTPKKEVDLCGHATIAAFSLMLKLNIIKKRNYTQKTKIGILNIKIDKDKTIFMEQKTPCFSEIIKKEEIATSLKIPINLIEENLPIQVVSTGLRDILIPIKSLKSLYSIKPDFKKISDISKKYNVVGYHLFTLETIYNSTAHCRNFAPLYGIFEEAATGTSSGALSCFLWKNFRINKTQSKKIIYEQGYSMKRPSEILSNLEIRDKKIIKVKVGGKALNIKKIEIPI